MTMAQELLPHFALYIAVLSCVFGGQFTMILLHSTLVSCSLSRFSMSSEPARQLGVRVPALLDVM